jgi:hypothetical protein
MTGKMGMRPRRKSTDLDFFLRKAITGRNEQCCAAESDENKVGKAILLHYSPPIKRNLGFVIAGKMPIGFSHGRAADAKH